MDEGEWWYLIRYIDEKLRYTLQLLHNHQDTIEEGDMMMVYTVINEVISRIETINEIEDMKIYELLVECQGCPCPDWKPEEKEDGD